MIRIGRRTLAATIAEMASAADEVIARVEAGNRVVVQRDGRPAAIVLPLEEHRALVEANARLDDLELARIARARERAVLDGADGLLPLDDLLREFGVQGEPDG